METQNSKDLISIGEAAVLFGVSADSLRRWEEMGQIVPNYTLGGHRRYCIADLKMVLGKTARQTHNHTIDYLQHSIATQEENITHERQLLDHERERISELEKSLGERESLIAEFKSAMRYLTQLDNTGPAISKRIHDLGDE